MEPYEELFRKASANCRPYPNIQVLHGTSEALFPSVLEKIEGNVSFWLDGHYSSGSTFQGACDTPIREELQQIQRHLPRLGKVAVLIDDVRCFDPEMPEFGGYPSRDFLVDWARENGLKWHIEHDIFIARNF
jgi:hypothetical protein